jgi:hypothetical protein
MVNWRRPILHFYDTRITHSPIPGCVAFLNELYAWPIERRRQVERLWAPYFDQTHDGPGRAVLYLR